MKKFKKIIALGLAATVAVSAMSMSIAFADSEGKNFESIRDNVRVIDLEGNIGDEFDLGHGVKARIISHEEAERIKEEVAELEVSENIVSDEANKYNTTGVYSFDSTNAFRYAWNTTFVSSEHVRICDFNLETTNSYPYWRWIFENTQSSSNYVLMAVCDYDFSEDPDMETALTTIMRVRGGKGAYLYSTTPWDAGTYYARIQSDNIITGTTNCIRATSIDDLNIDELE